MTLILICMWILTWIIREGKINQLVTSECSTMDCVIVICCESLVGDMYFTCFNPSYIQLYLNCYKKL